MASRGARSLHGGMHEQSSSDQAVWADVFFNVRRKERLVRELASRSLKIYDLVGLSLGDSEQRHQHTIPSDLDRQRLTGAP
jgi:hypothetical protein